MSNWWHLFYFCHFWCGGFADDINLPFMITAETPCLFFALKPSSPTRSLSPSLSEDHAIGLSTFTIMAGLGGSLGYVMGALDWGSLGKHDHHDHDHHSFMIVNLMIFMIVIIMGSLDRAATVTMITVFIVVIVHTSIALI